MPGTMLDSPWDHHTQRLADLITGLIPLSFLPVESGMSAPQSIDLDSTLLKGVLSRSTTKSHQSIGLDRLRVYSFTLILWAPV